MFELVSRTRSLTLRGRREADRRTRLRLEWLEERCLLSVMPARPQTISVMTQNVYVGADTAPLVAAAASGDEALLVAAATQFLDTVINDTRYDERMAEIAQQINDRDPALVALQEVARFDFTPIAEGDAASASIGPASIDYLATLLADLPDYTAAVVNPEFTLHGVIGGYEGMEHVTMTDRDVILVRNDLVSSITTSQVGHFKVNAQVKVGEDQLVVQRGWASVDMKVAGTAFRFVTTHLESPDNLGLQIVQTAQAAELLTGPALTTMPLIMAGDFNAPADSPWTRPGALTYQLLVKGGFLRDAWSTTNRRDPGPTWGNKADLSNATPMIVDPQRIDLVLTRGLVLAKSMSRVGINPLADRTPSGLWASDHAGVIATLTVYPSPFTSSTMVTRFSQTVSRMWCMAAPLINGLLTKLGPALQNLQLSQLPISLPRWSAILPGMLQLNVQSLATLLPQWLRQAPSLLAGSFFGGAGVGSSTTLAKTIQGVLGNLPRSQEALTAALDRVVLRLDQLGLDRVAAILRQV